jgi:outer membrane protein assembly factor BamB
MGDGPQDDGAGGDPTEVDPTEVGATEVDNPEQHSAATSDARSRGPRVSRRTFLRAAVMGGVAVGAASLGYWGAEARNPNPLLSTFTPQPSTTAGTRGFRSRPDLSAPLISMTAPGVHAAAGQVFLTPHSGPGPIIADNTGAPIWIHPVANKQTFNVRVGSYRGSPVLTWWEGAVVTGTGKGEYVLLDSAYREVARVQAGNGLQGDLHEFITTADGTGLFTAYAPRDLALSTAGTNQLLDSILQEVDITSGEVVFEWHASEHVSPEESYAVASAGQQFDFFHINSIDVDSDGNLLISARHTWALYKIDRQTGEVIWRLGGKKSDFAMGTGARFAWQHDARRQADGSITVFDDGSNGSKPPTESQSRGIVLDVNESTRVATLRREYKHAGILALSQGSTEPLPNGNVLVGWGDQPYFTEFAPDGTVVLDASLPAGSASYRTLRYQWQGTPAEAPAVVTEPAEGAATRVFVSWNGATDVATWVVLGGDSAQTLTPLGSRPRVGFETAILIGGQPRFVAVRALDAAGKIIVESGAVSV